MKYSALLGGFVIALLTATTNVSAASTDFELSALEKKLKTTRDTIAVAAVHLNVGDVRASRNEPALAKQAYATARSMLSEEARRAGANADLARYSRAIAYLGIAEAKLGEAGAARRSFEEALRYQSDSPSIWNLYSSAMTVLGYRQKAIANARVAVHLGADANTSSSNSPSLLDLAVFKYGLANALLRNESDEASSDEAAILLADIIELLQSDELEQVRERVVRNESFEVFSSTDGDENAFVALRNRARLRLARLYEQKNRPSLAREEYERLLADRTDDAAALSALARMTASTEEKQKYFEAAFEADPYSISLIDEYERYLMSSGSIHRTEDATSEVTVRRALTEHALTHHLDEKRTLEKLLVNHPENATLLYLLARTEIEGDDSRCRTGFQPGKAETCPGLASISSGRLPIELRRRLTRAIALRTNSSGSLSLPSHPMNTAIDLGTAELEGLRNAILAERLTPEQKQVLDDQTFRATVQFDSVTNRDLSTTTFMSGRLLSVAFRFSQPSTFKGDYEVTDRLILEFRLLGVTEEDGKIVLLLEPVRLVRT